MAHFSLTMGQSIRLASIKSQMFSISLIHEYPSFCYAVCFLEENWFDLIIRFHRESAVELYNKNSKTKEKKIRYIL